MATRNILLQYVKNSVIPSWNSDRYHIPKRRKRILPKIPSTPILFRSSERGRKSKTTSRDLSQGHLAKQWKDNCLPPSRCVHLLGKRSAFWRKLVFCWREEKGILTILNRMHVCLICEKGIMTGTE